MFSAVIVILGLYIVAAIWVRRKDKQDLVKVSSALLPSWNTKTSGWQTKPLLCSHSVDSRTTDRQSAHRQLSLSRHRAHRGGQRIWDSIQCQSSDVGKIVGSGVRKLSDGASQVSLTRVSVCQLDLPRQIFILEVLRCPHSHHPQWEREDDKTQRLAYPLFTMKMNVYIRSLRAKSIAESMVESNRERETKNCSELFSFSPLTSRFRTSFVDNFCHVNRRLGTNSTLSILMS